MGETKVQEQLSVVDVRTWVGAATLVDPAVPMRRGSLMIAETRIRGMLKWWRSVLAFGLGNPVLYLMSVGIGIGSLVNKHMGANGLDHVPYLTFLAPALLVTAAIQGAMDEVTFPTLQGFNWDRSFYSMNATAISPRQIVNGVMLAAVARCIVQVALYEAALIAFGAISISSVPALTIGAIFAGFSFASVMFALSARIKDDDGVFAIVGRFIITPMFMFSGTYYPLASLPIYLQWIGWISPVWHATQIGRALSYGMPITPEMFLLHIGFLSVLAVVGMSLTYPPFKKRLAN